jgi:hypothetical protein
MMSGSAPLAMKTPQPDFVASLAAESLLTIPPTAVTLDVPPAIASISGVIRSTTGTTRPEPFMSTRPGAVERMRRNWAPTRLATIAESVSLSPNPPPGLSISAELTVSFSLMTGTAP